MMQITGDHILLIGDRDRHVHEAIETAMPDARIVRAQNVFDGIAELHAQPFSAVISSVEPIERRPEPAVATIRQLIGRGRVILFGHTTLEPLARKMLNFGVDDYFVTPADPGEIREILKAKSPASQTKLEAPTAPEGIASISSLLSGNTLLDLTLDAMINMPQASVAKLAEQLASKLPANVVLSLSKETSLADPSVSHPVRNTHEIVGHLHLGGEAVWEDPSSRQVLAQLASLFSRVAVLEERHNLMQKLAITDELTGLHNGRYFHHFLNRIIEKAKVRRFAVTLLLFDIDNFKRYNDLYGHGVGDDILRQTASLMRRCCRDHDLVARIGGDEFAVVFWEKDAPRVPRDPESAGSGRVPSTPLIIAQRFRKQLGSSEFSALGKFGQGQLTISGGMAVYPFDGQTPADLIKAADNAQMFGAKRGGKNRIHLVGSDETLSDDN
jgi:GGDEF domain-containing protein